jgi:hypothetical protein
MIFGLFNLNEEIGLIESHLKDGEYLNLLTDEPVKVALGKIDIPESALIIKV